MYKFPIGIILDSFRKPFPEALDITRSLGAQGVQVYATRGEMSPENLTGQKRRDFLNAVKDRRARDLRAVRRSWTRLPQS